MTDQELLERVLDCYKPHCRYLVSMTVSTNGDAADDTVRGVAELAIGESCYIDDTGHLNAVEVNIAYNQMLYYVLAKAVQEQLVPAFAGWSMADYWRRRLPDVLIAKLLARFRRPIDPRRFSGEFTLTRVVRRRSREPGPPLVVLDTAFRFWDDHGRADGEVTVAVKTSVPSGQAT